MTLIQSPLRTRAGSEVEARRAGHLRRLNMERILAAAMDHTGPFTRAELTRTTGLSAPTVGTLAAHLLRTGLLKDLGTGPSRGGRRPSFMEFNSRHGFVAGIDLGPTRTRLAIADLRGERLGSRVVPTPTDLGPAPLLARMAAAVKSLLREAGVSPDRLLAVGAGAPGVVDPETGTVVALAPNLKGWSRVPMAQILRKAMGVPVIVENDVNLAVLGERWRGAAKGHDTCVYVSMGTGIGAGIVVDGVLHRGHHLVAGEIAFMCLGPQFLERDFGSQGCLETLAGLKALASRWPRAAWGGPERWVTEMFEAVESGDRRARKAVEESASLIGIAVANLSLVLDPSLVVLGGALAQGRAFVEELRRVVGRLVPAPLEMVVSALGTEAPLWGSLLVATVEARVRLRQRLREERAR